VVRRFLVTCLGDADAIFARLYAQLRELGWVGAHTVVVIVAMGGMDLESRHHVRAPL